MLAQHRSHESVYLVTAPIPMIGAQPGDELVVRPTDEDCPVTLLRYVAPEFTATIPESAVTLDAETDVRVIRRPTPSAYLRAALIATSHAPDSDVPVGQEADEAPRPALRLVR